MKKLFSFCLFFLLLVHTACQPQIQSTAAEAGQAASKFRVTVTTSFLEDMVENLAGEWVDLKVIIPAGSDPHLYTAKPEDLSKVKDCDLLLYHGLHFEGKMNDVLEARGVAVSQNFMPEEIGRMTEAGLEIIDPHFWFDIKLYQKAVQTAAEALQKGLPEQAGKIAEKAEVYQGKLQALQKEFEEKLARIPSESRVLVTPHDAFNYFARSFRFEVVAPQGVSTDSEVANKDVQAVVDLICERKIKAIFAESTTNPERMKKIQEACRAQGFEVEVLSDEAHLLFSDSLAPKGQPGDSYIEMYRHNIDCIVEKLKP